MKAKNNKGLRAALVAVLGSLILAAGFAGAVGATGKTSTSVRDALVADPTAGLPKASVARALADIQQPKAAGCSTATPPHGAWRKLGGDPALPGGAWTRGAFQSFINGSRGRTYLDLALDGDQIKIDAVRRQVREDNFETGVVNYCDVFPTESFGRNGPTVTRNVTFMDPSYRNYGAPAWKVKVVLSSKLVKTTVSGATTAKTYALFVVVLTAPMKCVNLAPNYYTVHVVVKTKRLRPKPGKAPVTLVKIALDAYQHQLPATPTGTFQFQAVINGKTSWPVYNHPPRQIVGWCTIGSRVSMKELKPHSDEQWKLISPKNPYLSQICTKQGAMFVYKNMEMVPPPTTTTTTVATTTVVTTTTEQPKGPSLPPLPPTTTVQPKGNNNPSPPPSNPGPGTTPPPTTTTTTTTAPPPGCDPLTDPYHCTGVAPSP